MWRIGRLFAGCAIGLSLLLAPVSAAVPAEATPVVAVAQQPTPDAPAPERETQAERNQRTAMGVAGVVLIGLVLLSRKMRKKPVLFYAKKK
ncbi:hypothetical protein EIL87_24170 [Saccharopolyspora rhizosphaerae]|uniref:LPXTG cell wall anchor domain-containing protein n=1 Tax=Saccharopolyspora rhizosphaerae TaxID=2492662 RepID=A0A426JI46_9PSEU|nr:hypothetical protein [Saccharopolyspora rhizosphaerae]RRO12787.1 hypothetical protein EIL87_24170 [Saccharopolyspora rhizosphaerae]